MTDPTHPTAREVNFDGLVGPTHNYAGLSLGNRASMKHAGAVSRPKQAAHQGVAKMRMLVELGVPQGVIPPLFRPDPSALSQLGFVPDASIGDVDAVMPQLTAPLMSASSMWAANAATVSPSTDTADGRVHFTPANLSSTLHRSFEHFQTIGLLRAIFADDERFVIHEALPAQAAFSDEGAANHGRLTVRHDQRGVEVFVYGRDADEPVVTTGYPRRQSRLASEMIALNHHLDAQRVLFVRQSPIAIDAGAFHNDVVSVINERVVFTHELCFDDRVETYDRFAAALPGAVIVEVPNEEVPLGDAVSSYLFNSQLVTLPDGSMTLITPTETAETESTARYLERAVADVANPIASVHAMDLRQSMHNGGGPACLRLRVVLTPEEQAAVVGNAIVTPELLDQLDAWIDRHYRDELSVEDLTDPALVTEEIHALDELTTLLRLPALYPFQT